MARRHLSSQRAAEIASLAESYANYYFPNQWIDPQGLIEKTAISLSFGYYQDAFDGMLEWRDGAFHIYCNLSKVENCTSTRARFTLGHELGHFFIDEHRNALASGRVPAHPSFCNHSNAENAVEAEANHFASNLLMPSARVEKVVNSDRSTASMSDVTRLQNTFDVSFQSGAIRAIEGARVALCAGVMWRANGTKWPIISPAFEAAGYRYLNSQREHLQPDSATAKCLRTGKEAGEWNVTKASLWFGVRANSTKDILLKEEAMALGSYGVFTFLSKMDL